MVKTMNVKAQRRIKTKKVKRPKPVAKPTIKIDVNTNNHYIKRINTMYSVSKSKTERKKVLVLSVSFFERKKQNLQQILNALANGVNTKKIFVTFEDFDFHEFQAIGAERYSKKLATEIVCLDEAKKYTNKILKILC